MFRSGTSAARAAIREGSGAAVGAEPTSQGLARGNHCRHGPEARRRARPGLALTMVHAAASLFESGANNCVEWEGPEEVQGEVQRPLAALVGFRDPREEPGRGGA